MSNVIEFNNYYNFINPLLEDRTEQYKEAEWRLNSFDDNTWVCDFSDGNNGRSTTIHFDKINLEDQSSLIDTKNAGLLLTFKYWLCIHTHFDMTGGQEISRNTQYRKVRSTLHLIDYFLIHSTHFKLAKHGLKLVTENDINSLIFTLASSNHVYQSVYEWDNRLTEFLKDAAKNINPKEAAAITYQNPFLKENNDEYSLNLTTEELINARAYLWKNGWFNKASSSSDYLFTLNTRMMSQAIYSNTLAGQSSQHKIPLELHIHPKIKTSREYPMVPVKKYDAATISPLTLRSYKAILRGLGLLGVELNLPVPINALDWLDNKAIEKTLKLCSLGRYKSLPHAVVIESLKNAIEFSLEYGDDIVDSYLNLISNSMQNNRSISRHVYIDEIEPYLTTKVKRLGVTKWGFPSVTYDSKERSYIPISSDTFYRDFRAAPPLLGLIRLLFGSIQIILGTMTARRIGELMDLVAGKCLDKSETHLLFYNRKSGAMGKRVKEARPIPEICVRVVKLLERLQFKCIELGVQNSNPPLLACPNPKGDSLSVSGTGFSRNFDYFCDFFETPQNSKGQRYYIRSHQLRRFFAMTFFWSNSYAGMDTLRWFMGHTDIEHLYHYITESIQGAALRAVKANFVTEEVRHKEKVSQELEDLLEEHFKTKNFSVLATDELEEYIEELIDEGDLEVEPHFFETEEGQRHKILINVRRKG